MRLWCWWPRWLLPEREATVYTGHHHTVSSLSPPAAGPTAMAATTATADSHNIMDRYKVRRVNPQPLDLNL